MMLKVNTVICTFPFVSHYYDMKQSPIQIPSEMPVINQFHWMSLGNLRCTGDSRSKQQVGWWGGGVVGVGWWTRLMPE